MLPRCEILLDSEETEADGCEHTCDQFRRDGSDGGSAQKVAKSASPPAAAAPQADAGNSLLGLADYGDSDDDE
jgi:hypothetical protein